MAASNKEKVLKIRKKMKKFSLKKEKNLIYDKHIVKPEQGRRSQGGREAGGARKGGRRSQGGREAGGAREEGRQEEPGRKGGRG
jgi:hypothetical protein